MLTVNHLSVSYGQHRALDDVSVTIEKGEVVVILGANGAGKSSLLRAIAGLSEGNLDGDIFFNGTALIGQNPDEIVGAGIALVPEGRAIFGDLSVEENLRLGAYNDRARGNEAANLDRVLTLFPKLRERRRQISRTMSGGEQQMVAIGRALMSEPSILMLDEPSLGLSPLLSKELFVALGKIRDTGPGVLVVEQNAKLSLAIADRGYLIENSHIIGENDAASLAADPNVQSAYLGGSGYTKGGSHKTVITPPPVSASSSSSVSADAEQGEKVFVTPAGLDAGESNASALIGEDINGLLGRASDAAKPSPSPLVPKAGIQAVTPIGDGKPSIIEIAPSQIENVESQMAPDHQKQTGGDAAPDNPITAMLNDMEAAARRARQSYHDNNEAAHNTSPPDQTLREDGLPEIPVFKKTRVEVFKRDAGGVLIKSKEV